MTTTAHRARLLAAGLLLCAPLTQAATPAAASPFSKVPALPTACYSQGETLYPKLDAARTAIHADQSAQEAVNTQIQERHNNIDPMEQAALLQQWMMDNPQEAMAYMQGVQNVAATEPAKIQADQTADAKFRTDRDALAASYKAAMKEVNAPFDTRFDDLNKRAHADNGCSWGMGECSPPAWALAEFAVIQRERDAAYAAACPGWWGPTGQITAYFKRYKDWLTGTHLPYVVGLEVHRTNQYAIFNTPAASYRSIEPYRSALEYIDAVYPIYQQRPETPHCGPKGCN
jgi:hypothetical protein